MNFRLIRIVVAALLAAFLGAHVEAGSVCVHAGGAGMLETIHADAGAHHRAGVHAEAAGRSADLGHACAHGGKAGQGGPESHDACTCIAMTQAFPAEAGPYSAPSASAWRWEAAPVLALSSLAPGRELPPPRA